MSTTRPPSALWHALLSVGVFIFTNIIALILPALLIKMYGSKAVHFMLPAHYIYGGILVVEVTFVIVNTRRYLALRHFPHKTIVGMVIYIMLFLATFRSLAFLPKTPWYVFATESSTREVWKDGRLYYLYTSVIGQTQEILYECDSFHLICNVISQKLP